MRPSCCKLRDRCVLTRSQATIIANTCAPPRRPGLANANCSARIADEGKPESYVARCSNTHVMSSGGRRASGGLGWSQHRPAGRGDVGLFQTLFGLGPRRILMFVLTYPSASPFCVIFPYCFTQTRSSCLPASTPAFAFVRGLPLCRRPFVCTKLALVRGCVHLNLACTFMYILHCLITPVRPKSSHFTVRAFKVEPSLQHLCLVLKDLSALAPKFTNGFVLHVHGASFRTSGLHDSGRLGRMPRPKLPVLSAERSRKAV